MTSSFNEEECISNESVTKDRFDRLLATIRGISDTLIKKHEGTIQKVLVEEVNEQDSTLVTGRLTNNVLVHFKGCKELIGSIVDVKLSECKGFYYIGEMTEV